MRIEALETLAREMVGDGGTPNAFFVTDGGNVTMVTTNEEEARRAWECLADRLPLQESALEDRQTGVLASVEPEDDDSPRLVRCD